ncbi:MAG: hypothetical protein IPI67_23235 [Myxococcales bacterium]|nr:hypothetical protein [Myxococcales bacterium]
MPQRYGWPRRVLAVCLAGLAAAGCPQLQSDDFSTVPAGSGGQSGDASLGGKGGDADAAGGTTGGGTGGIAGSGASGGTAGADAGPCATCATGEACCDDVCVDLSSSPSNCGVCGVGCPGTTCASGQCTNTCVLGHLDCDKNAVTGCEIDSAVDPANCGSCGAMCTFDQTCALGKCSCPSGTANCDGQAGNGCETQLASAKNNCGACGVTCGANQTCVSGKCECATGFGDCNADKNDGCEANFGSDAKNCGVCAKSCGANGTCSTGNCGCLAGFQDCDATVGCETSLTDPQHCASCATQCSAPTAACDGTSCVANCASSETLCGNSCVDTSKDPQHCGGCSQPVGPNQKCTAGQPDCLNGFANCNSQAGDGCEIDLTANPTHCGSCTTVCKPGSVCSGSLCQCAASTPNDCGSSCRECCSAANCADSDPCTTESCDGNGKCGSAGCTTGNQCCAAGCFQCCVDTDCTGGKVCSGNQCVTPTCTGSELLCGGYCINPNTDPKNCGGCGGVCGVGRSCAAGVCTPPWAPVTSAGAPSARSHAAYAALSSPGRVFIWGGVDAVPDVLDDGVIYDVTTDSFAPIVQDLNTPSPRILASAVWTGNRVFVWGGGNGSTDLSDGALYDPALKSWLAVAKTGAPSGRRAPILVWTGSEVLVWGGFDANGSAVAGTYRYDPQQNSWKQAATSGAPAPRVSATVGWNGTDFLIYGGDLGPSNTNQTFRYQPSTDAWTQLANGPSQRLGAFGDWDGNYLIAWGGRKSTGGSPTTYDDGKRLDGSSWSNLSTTSPPGARLSPQREAGFSARVSNGVTLVLGGLSTSDTVLNDGGIYRSGTNAWTPVGAWPSGEDHLFAVGAFAAGEFVVWGGINGSKVTATGERFRP